MDESPEDDAAAGEDLPDTLFEDLLAGEAPGDASDGATGGIGDGAPDPADDPLAGEALADEAPRHNALPRRVESWRTRSASGAVISAMAMGLRQVFEPERRKPAIVAEAPGDPYDDDDPIVVDYVADDASGTTVILRPWLLPGAEASEGEGDAERADAGHHAGPEDPS